MAKKIKQKEVVEQVKDSIELHQFYNQINDNILHVTTLLMCYKMLRTHQFDLLKLKQYLIKYNSTFCPQCGNNVDKVVCVLEKMAFTSIITDLLPSFPKYTNPIYNEKINQLHAAQSLCDIRFLLEGVLYQEKSKEIASGRDTAAQVDYNNLLNYYNTRINYNQFLIDKLNSIPLNTEKDKEVYNEIKEFINKFR